MKKHILSIILTITINSLISANHIVTNTADNGAGSLRYALQMCLTAQGPHNISFNIPVTDAGYDSSCGVWVISPSTDLPLIMKEGVSIDGTSQTQFAGDTNPNGPEIVIDGGGNRDYGLRFMNAGNAVVRGINIRRFTKGVQFYNSPNCCVAGCYIGTDQSGTSVMPNDIGLEFISGSDDAVIGGTDLSERNIVSGNLHIGIRLLDVKRCKVAGNLIGTDRTGTCALPNYDGMSLEGAVQQCVIGGTETGERNIISGNTDYGLPLFGVGATQNVIIGNYIGTDATGTAAIGNTYGVLFDDGSFGNRVGGESEAERNVISGNVGYGVFFYNNGTNSNVLINNYIGTDKTGILAVPNAAGIIIDGISYGNVIDRNIISGNLQSGIGINITGSDENVITRNKIGVNAVGTPLPNGIDGIRISQGPRKTRIGGTPDEANVIAYNGGCGVYLTNANCTETRISCNSFYGNGGLAIDLFEPGVNHNDAGDSDDGANGKLNFPEITAMSLAGTGIAIEGTLDTQQPDLCEIQVYEAAPDPTGHGEGKRFLMSATPNADGLWSATLTSVGNDAKITSLTIDAKGNTSEFGATWNLDGPLSSSEKAGGISIYPNPTNNVVALSLCQRHKEAVATLSDMSGRTISTAEMSGGQASFDLTDAASGVYLINIHIDGQEFSYKVTKK